MSNEIKILLCTHKESELPKDNIYLPIQVGKAVSGIDLGIQGDNSGDNISEKNKNFCELTALYWAWKNIKNLYPDIKYIGLSHYRRFFLFEKNLKKDLKKYQIILPKKIVHSYSNAIDYAICHINSDYDLLKEIVYTQTPEYKNAFDRFMYGSNKGSFFNMFISDFDLFIEYCSWLFPILFELENRIDLTGRDKYQARVFGFMAERLLNIFVYKHSLSSKLYPVQYHNEKNNIIIGQSYQSDKDILQSNLIFYTTKVINKIFSYL